MAFMDYYPSRDHKSKYLPWTSTSASTGGQQGVSNAQDPIPCAVVLSKHPALSGTQRGLSPQWLLSPIFQTLHLPHNEKKNKNIHESYFPSRHHQISQETNLAPTSLFSPASHSFIRPINKYCWQVPQGHMLIL